MRKLCLIIWGVFFTLHTFAQFHLDARLSNNHLWRGIEVADGMVVTSDLSLSLIHI